MRGVPVLAPAAAEAGAQVNPAAGFYATPAARLLAALLRTVHRAAPRLAAAGALRLFTTPLPGKSHARAKPVPAPWFGQPLAFERGRLTAWRRSDVAPGAPRVLLVHGWAGDAQQWRALGDRLAAAGYDPVLLDLPAHGRSDGRSATLPQWVRALFAATAPLGPWHAVVAHSLGALASAHAVARGLPAGRLALVATSPPPRQFLRWFAAALGPGEAMARRMQAHFERREGVAMTQFEADWLAGHLHRPALLLHDPEDRIAPQAEARRLAQALPQAAFEAWPGLGHRRILADPGVQARLLRFVGGDADTLPLAATAAPATT